MSIFEQLAAPFPKEKVHWRAQSLTKDGTKAMALAYVDARDVMDRLDEVCGPGGWKDGYFETQTGRVMCNLSIRVDDEWVSKADGAGATQMEGEKGGISDAFKRAGVKWGIARYLYALPAPWVPCESYERQGKKVWKKWTANPWDYCGSIDGGVHPGDESGVEDYGQVTQIKSEITALVEHVKNARTSDEVMTLKAQYEFAPKGGKSLMDRAKHFPATKSWHDRVCQVFADRGAELATTNAA